MTNKTHEKATPLTVGMLSNIIASVLAYGPAAKLFAESRKITKMHTPQGDYVVLGPVSAEIEALFSAADMFTLAGQGLEMSVMIGGHSPSVTDALGIQNYERFLKSLAFSALIAQYGDDERLANRKALDGWGFAVIRDESGNMQFIAERDERKAQHVPSVEAELAALLGSGGGSSVIH